MLTNLLTSALPEGYQVVSIGTAALYALIGQLVVFSGIAFLVFIVWGVGKLMKKSSSPLKQKSEKISEPPSVTATTANSEDISEETVAVIMAALMAYYEKNNPKCEFTVKRIKKI